MAGKCLIGVARIKKGVSGFKAPRVCGQSKIKERNLKGERERCLQ